MILVTGATGHLGGAVIQQLLHRTAANQIVAFARDEHKVADLVAKGVQIRVGHYDDIDSLDKAMQGVETVLLIAGTDETNRLRQHQHVIDAARRASVQRVAYTSRALKDRTTLANQLMESHFQTEDYIKASGLTYTLFQNILYMDAIPQFVGPTVFDEGINLPAGQGSVSFALRSEMGEAMANALVTDASDSRVYKLTNTETYTFADVATTLTDLTGKTVTYTPIERPVFEQRLTARGLPDVVARRIANFITDIANGQEDAISPDLTNLLGRRPASLHEGLRQLYPA